MLIPMMTISGERSRATEPRTKRRDCSTERFEHGVGYGIQKPRNRSPEAVGVEGKPAEDDTNEDRDQICGQRQTDDGHERLGSVQSPTGISCGNFDVSRRQEIDLIGDTIHLPAERVTEPAGKVDKTTPKVSVGSLQVDYHCLA